MKAQHLILKCNGSTIPNDGDFREFVFQQLDNPNVDYYGNPLIAKSHEKTRDNVLLNFHFTSPFEVDEETAIDIITWAFYKRRIEEVKKFDDKEVAIFLS